MSLQSNQSSDTSESQREKQWLCYIEATQELKAEQRETSSRNVEPTRDAGRLSGLSRDQYASTEVLVGGLNSISTPPLHLSSV